jgi:ribonuclease D
MMFKENITDKELIKLPLKWFKGDIYVIDRVDDVADVAEFLSMQQVIGFDTETRPSFKKGVVNKVALLQLSTLKEAFLIRINKIGLPKSLQKILTNPGIIKPGVAIRDDLKGLQEFAQFNPNGFVELQDYAKELGIHDFSLKKMTAIVMGFRISKSQQLSNWEADTLSEAQKKYAATDAWAALQIYQHLPDY